MANFGRYLIRRELGRGAMGVVYEARDTESVADVALKVIALAPGLSAETRRRQEERFDREAAALAQLDHPRVVRLLDRGEVDGRRYFVMELVAGTTLRDRLQMQGALSVAELVRLGIEMGHALDHVHQRGIVHRDVKPENIMLLPDGGAKLMDFGIARLVLEQETAASSGFQGSPSYMSPEQVAGLRVDGRSDLYSLAVTLYEAATGRRAVEGDSIPAILHKVAHEYPPPPAGLPPALQAILMRAMAKDPGQRYVRGAELADDIREGRMPAQTFSPIAPPPPGFAPPSGFEPRSGYEPPRLIYLGADAPPAPAAPADSTVMSGWSAASLPSPPLPSPPLPAPPLPAPEANPTPAACRLHTGTAAVAVCGACGQPLCYTCLLDVPGRGVICRTCAFARPPR
jgi:serine/threonine protein kinase